MTACKRSCCSHFDQERFNTYFERVMHMEPMSVVMQSFAALRSVFLWAQLKGDSSQASLNIWVLKLMIILLFRELLGRCNREVVCACQACDAGSKAKTVVASWAAVLIFTHQRWRVVSRHSNVPCVLTTSQSSGGCTSAFVHPVHKTLVDSSRRVRWIVCFAAAASVGSWSCVGKRVRSRILVVVCSYCRRVWDRGRCTFLL